MGYARLFFIIQFYFCTISKIMIARCDDDAPSWIEVSFSHYGKFT